MKNVLKNIFKWLLLVCISFSVIFTVILSMEYEWGVIESIAYKALTINEPIIYNMESSELEEVCKNYQKNADKAIGIEDKEKEKVQEIEKESENKKEELMELYRNYPIGFAMLINEIGLMKSMSSLNIISLVMGIVVGTGIYLVQDKEKRGIKVVITLYLLFILVLGFVEGISSVAGSNITLLERWIFPETYIVPVTVMFGLVIVMRIIRRKNIGNELNEKLKERGENK